MRERSTTVTPESGAGIDGVGVGSSGFAIGLGERLHERPHKSGTAETRRLQRFRVICTTGWLRPSS
jgi:hypothetical protein